MSINENRTKSTDLNSNPFIIISCVVASICVFITNYNFNVTNIPQSFIKSCDPKSYRIGLSSNICISDNFFGWIASIMSIGGFLGCFVAIYFSGRIGRKLTLVYNNIGFLVGGLVVAFTNSKFGLLAGRLVIGISGGISQTVAPMYVAEIATIKRRGMLGLIVPISGEIGGVFALVFGFLLKGYFYWRIIFGFIIVPAIMQALLFYFLVETPRYFLVFKQELAEKGKSNLQKLRGECDIEDELDEIATGTKNACFESSQIKAIGMLLSKRYRKRFFLAFAVLVSQGLCGISAIDYYSQTILEKHYDSDLSSIFVIVCSTSGVIFAILISFFIDKIGRKLFLLVSLFGVGCSCLMIAFGNIYDISKLVLSGIFINRTAYGLGLAGIPFVIASELFPTYLLSGGSGVVMAAGWVSHFVIGVTFNYLKEWFKEYVFITYVVTNFAMFVIIYFFLPQTQSMSIEEIEREFDETNKNLQV